MSYPLDIVSKVPSTPENLQCDDSGGDISWILRAETHAVISDSSTCRLASIIKVWSGNGRIKIGYYSVVGAFVGAFLKQVFVPSVLMPSVIELVEAMTMVVSEALDKLFEGRRASSLAFGVGILIAREVVLRSLILLF